MGNASGGLLAAIYFRMTLPILFLSPSSFGPGRIRLHPSIEPPLSVGAQMSAARSPTGEQVEDASRGGGGPGMSGWRRGKRAGQKSRGAGGVRNQGGGVYSGGGVLLSVDVHNAVASVALPLRYPPGLWLPDSPTVEDGGVLETSLAAALVAFPHPRACAIPQVNEDENSPERKVRRAGQ